LGDLWRSRPSPSAGKKNDVVPTAVAPSAAAISTFKRWRRGGRSSPGHAENCTGKDPAAEEERSLLKFLALVSLPTVASVCLSNRVLLRS